MMREKPISREKKIRQQVQEELKELEEKREIEIWRQVEEVKEELEERKDKVRCLVEKQIIKDRERGFG